MGGKGSGGARANSGQDKKYTSQNADANRRMMNFCKDLMGYELVDFEDGEEQWRRFEGMLRACDKWNLRPNVPALCMVMGMNNAEMYRVLNREFKTYKGQKITELFVQNIQKMYDFVQVYLETALIEEQKNPVKWLFLAKNHFGYTDSRENVIKTVAEKPQLESAEDVAARYRKKLGKTSDDVIEVQNLAAAVPKKRGRPKKLETAKRKK